VLFGHDTTATNNKPNNSFSYCSAHGTPPSRRKPPNPT